MNYYKQVYGNNCGCNTRQTRTVANRNSYNEGMNSCNNNCSESVCDNDTCGGTGRYNDNYDNWNGCNDKFPIAMAYVPWQKFENLYSVEESLCQGTIFKELDLDFYGRSCR